LAGGLWLYGSPTRFGSFCPLCIVRWGFGPSSFRPLAGSQRAPALFCGLWPQVVVCDYSVQVHMSKLLNVVGIDVYALSLAVSRFNWSCLLTKKRMSFRPGIVSPFITQCPLKNDCADSHHHEGRMCPGVDAALGTIYPIANACRTPALAR